ncbi:unnamed protein product [Clonostachys rosea f. rosea IK726]|uniref:Cytochrome P450 n=2 Tax=Bionectria ochroleuca TaxID=29856 RepID=A0A0B7KDK9_BIOOC|nr:unnamed protein product [Clonostachys rosea f. rosea IK726]
MALLTLPVLLAAAALLCVVALVRKLYSPLARIPGPKLSLFSSIQLRYHELHGRRTAFVHSMHRRYGTAVRLGPNEVSFASASALKEIYMSKGSGYDKTEFYDLFRQFGLSTMFSDKKKEPLLTGCVFFQHSKRRRILADRYANSNIMREDSLHGIQQRSQNFVTRIKESPKQELDIYLHLHNYAFDCVTHHLFHPHGSNSLLDKTDEEIMCEVSFDNSLVRRLMIFYNPTFGHFLGKMGLFGAQRAIPRAQALVKKAVKQENSASFTLVGALQDGKGSLDSTQIASECMDHMVAGIETTGDALCFLMWQLSQPAYVGLQDRLRAELRENAHMSIHELPFLDAVVKEGLRVFPSIPMSLPRCVPVGGAIVDGDWLPEGTTVSCQPFSMHRMDESVFPAPDNFNPDRWLEEKRNADRNRLFFSFSAGGRACIGRHLATAEMKTLLRDIYGQFRSTPADEMTADMTMDDQIFTTRPKGQKCLLKFTVVE